MTTKKATKTRTKSKTMKNKKTVTKAKTSNSKSRGFMSHSRAMLIFAALLVGGIGVYMLASSNAATTINVSAATYNILGQHHDPTHALDPWSMRKARVSNKISDYNPGIIGMQEVTYINPLNGKTSPQRGDVVKFMNAKGYTYYTGSTKNNSPIFWKKGTFTVLAKKEALIIAQNSKLEGPAARYLTYVRLQKGTKKISVFNYHYNQHRDDTAQLDKLKKYFNAFKVSGDRVIFTGDFNKRDLEVRNKIGLWRVDKHTGIDHVLASYSNVGFISWKNTGHGSPKASDHPLIGVKVTLK